MQHFPFCHHFRFCLSSAYTVRAYIWRKWVLMSLQTEFRWGGLGGRGGEQRRWQWRRTWIFRSNSTALPPWDVNCPFPFPSDQGGHDKINCRPVILSTQGPVSQKTALTFGWVFSHQAQQRQIFWQEIESTSGFGCRHLFWSLARGAELTAGSGALWSGLFPWRVMLR